MAHWGRVSAKQTSGREFESPLPWKSQEWPGIPVTLELWGQHPEVCCSQKIATLRVQWDTLSQRNTAEQDTWHPPPVCECTHTSTRMCTHTHTPHHRCTHIACVDHPHYIIIDNYITIYVCVCIYIYAHSFIYKYIDMHVNRNQSI